jgi:hypothetical protein
MLGQSSISRDKPDGLEINSLRKLNAWRYTLQHKSGPA